MMIQRISKRMISKLRVVQDHDSEMCQGDGVSTE